MSPFPRRREFFVDRSLGRRAVPAALREAGWSVHTLAEVYGDRDEEVADVEWLARCGQEGWPVLTKDRRIRYRPAEIAAIREHGVKAFVLVGGNLAGAEQAARYIRHARAIGSAAEGSGHGVWSVYRTRLVRIEPMRGARS